MPPGRLASRALTSGGSRGTIEVGRGADLAREPHARLGANSRESLGLGRLRRRQALLRGADVDAAGGAPAASAAHGRVRDACVAQRLEDRLAQRRDHDAAVRERDAEDPEAVAVDPPRLAGDEGKRDERHEHPKGDGLELLEPRDCPGRRRGDIGEHRGEVSRLSGPFGDRRAHPGEAQEREDRDDDRHRIKDRKEARIPGPMAKPKMDARAKMAPHDDQGERLLGTAERIGNPDGGHHVSVGGLETCEKPITRVPITWKRINGTTISPSPIWTASQGGIRKVPRL